MNQRRHFPLNGLHINDNPRNLHTAAGTARTGADKHQEQQYCLRKLGPQVKIHCRKSRRRHNRRRLKGRMVKMFEHTAGLSRQINGNQ